ncbi:MAG TPA: PAS domain-containing protein, partial [Solirubrobacteraceae bacterium]|nr:PAS domain-containing protein [Solirubrobacteraceae bacterium]
MTGTDTSDLEAELLAVGALPPIGDFRYATAILDPDGRYVLVNQAYASLHGGTPDELRGRAERDLVARTVATALGENDLLALDAPAGTVAEERVMDSVGRRRVVMCRSALRDAQGYPLAVCRMYGSATARDRILAEFRRLLDALDPTGTRAKDFEAAELGPDAAAAAAATVPAPPMPASRPDQAELLLAKAAVVDEREARQKAEALLAGERSARERLDREQAAAAERERVAVTRAAEV